VVGDRCDTAHRRAALGVALLEGHQAYDKGSRLEHGPGGTMCTYCSARDLAPGLTPGEGTCQGTPQAALPLESRE